MYLKNTLGSNVFVWNVLKYKPRTLFLFLGNRLKLN